MGGGGGVYFVVFVSEPVGGRSRVSCLVFSVQEKGLTVHVHVRQGPCNRLRLLENILITSAITRFIIVIKIEF